MLKKSILVCCSAALMLCLSNGCSSLTILRVRELKAVQAHVDSLKTDLDTKLALLNSNLNSGIATIAQEQKNQTELLRLIRADQQVSFESIEQKVLAVQENLSENKSSLSQIASKTQEIQEQWKAKTAADSLSEIQKQAQIQKLYEIAYGDFSAGRFDLAANGFADFIKKFPDALQLDEAAYWNAECYFNKKDYDKAEQLYSDYLRVYREGKKTCAALYKLGLIFETRKQLEKRKIVWEKLIATCPDADEAALAKNRLGK
jgi:tol-pal system protein YbgF